MQRLTHKLLCCSSRLLLLEPKEIDKNGKLTLFTDERHKGPTEIQFSFVLSDKAFKLIFTGLIPKICGVGIRKYVDKLILMCCTPTSAVETSSFIDSSTDYS